MTNNGKMSAALLEAINNPTRAAPLQILAHIKYPQRELQPCTLPDGVVQFSLTKWGFEYKSRGPRPKNPPPADTAAIMAALNATLSQFAVCSVTDRGNNIIITMEEKRSENIVHNLGPYR